MSFDPSVTASHESGIFGLPGTFEKSKLILLPVPWDVTTSYGGGTVEGPETIWKASPQIDLFDPHVGTSYQAGYFLLPIPEQLKKQNQTFRPKALQVRKDLEEQGELSKDSIKLQSEVNEACQKMKTWVYQESKKILDSGKFLGLIGGDHSTPLGAIQAIGEKFKGDYGILHIDAHADLRKAYQGFELSHASIMYNVMQLKERPKKLVQVGIRDFSEEEYQMIQDNPDIKTHFDKNLKDSLFEGQPWSTLCREIIQDLPENVYVSFDIDGLAPHFCPSTGTPVPGGLTFDEAVYLLASLVKAKKKVIGFDLNEVAPSGIEGDEWDGNVGARVLYKLCGFLVSSNR